MKCLHPWHDEKRQVWFNCGKCVNCRANKGSQWKLRCIYELDAWDSAIFVTLTYNDDWLLTHNISPQGFPTLKKRDAQLFVKRLKADISYNEPSRPLPKIFLCGEYSPKPKERPHYHAIIFGMDRFSERDRQYIIDNWCPPNAQRCDVWQFDRTRGKKDGIQEVSMADIGYVTDYASKKLFGDYAQKEYAERGREPPFHINSQGLGLAFALAHADRLRANNYSYINGQKIGLPKYLRDKLESEIVIRESSPELLKLKFQEENTYLQNLFEKETGFTFPKSESGLDWYLRQFQNWYDNHRFEYANQIFENFQKRYKIIHNKEL